MYEVEVKVPADHGPVRKRLAALDAEPLGTVLQHDVYYDHPTRSFADTDEALRLRRESVGGDEPSAVLTYKGPLVDDASKTREEVETGVADGDALDDVLCAVGFSAAATVEKERTRFALDGYTVALDAVAGLGEFVEVETEGEAGDVAELRDGAFAICERLGLDPDDAVRTSYLAMVLDAE